MEFEEGGGAFEGALLLEAAFGLDFAELVERFLELAGEPLGVHAEGGEGAVGVDDVEVDGSLIGGRVGGAIEEGGFEQRDAVEAPGGVGEFLGELGLGGGGGLVFVEELAAVALVGGGVLGSENGGAAGEAVALGRCGKNAVCRRRCGGRWSGVHWSDLWRRGWRQHGWWRPGDWGFGSGGCGRLS